MKKIRQIMAVIVVGVVLLFCAQAGAFQAEEWADPSGQKTGDALILTGSGWFYGIMVATDATNAVTVNVYDNTAASGTKIIPTWVVTTSATDRAQAFLPPYPISCINGIYVDVEGSGVSNYAVFYRAR